MTRVYLSSDRVRRLIDLLIPLYADAGNIKRLCELLNHAVGVDGDHKEIYPNRLHTILSEESTRALTEATVISIEQAVAAIAAGGSGEPRNDEPLHALFERVRTAWERSAGAARSVAEFTQMTHIPPAVVSTAIRALSLEQQLAPARDVRGPAPDPRFPRQPDWSYQDIACQRSLESLRRGPGRKVGLIVPTGGGKTRIALRIALRTLEQQPNGRVVWITHLHNLRTQAWRQLQRMLREEPNVLPKNAAALIDRIDFEMVSQLPRILADPTAAPLLVIVDEAHHAAAESYQPLHEADPPVRGLFLTATPNRTDDLPIGIEEIAFTITYRELFNLGVILMPTLRQLDPDFDWSEEAVHDLADHLLENAGAEYLKTLVICPSIAKVALLYHILVERLGSLKGHVLNRDDVAYLHSEGRSHGESAEDCLTDFAARPMGIMVSAQMLLEGHDDPTVNTVVMTTRTESLIKLMQAAGRCIRYSPGKTAAFVLYAADRNLQYRFNQRWLYQEIDDRLLPELIDIDYTSSAELREKVAALLDRHNVPAAIRDRAIETATDLPPGERFRVLLSGLSYFGSVAEFATRSSWSVITETAATTVEFRHVFNEFCRLGADLPATSDFLRHAARPFGLAEDQTPTSRWRLYHDMLAAMRFAHKEMHDDGSRSPLGTSRPYSPTGPTTWLKYVTFHYRPGLSSELEAFLADCFNRDAIAAGWPATPSRDVLVVKLPLPLAGFEAVLLKDEAAGAFRAACEAARAKLSIVAPSEQLSAFAGWRTNLQVYPLPWRILEKIDRYLNPAEFERLVFVPTFESA